MERHPRNPESVISREKWHRNRNDRVCYIYEPIDEERDIYLFYKLIFTHTHRHKGIWYNYHIVSCRRVVKTYFFDDDVIAK